MPNCEFCQSSDGEHVECLTINSNWPEHPGEWLAAWSQAYTIAQARGLEDYQIRVSRLLQDHSSGVSSTTRTTYLEPVESVDSKLTSLMLTVTPLRPTAVDLATRRNGTYSECYSCDPPCEVLHSIIRRTDHITLSVDFLKVRPYYIVSPLPHVRAVSDLSRADFAATMEDIRRVLVTDLHLSSGGTLWNIVVNHGTAQNHMHAHFKIQVSARHFARTALGPPCPIATRLHTERLCIQQDPSSDGASARRNTESGVVHNNHYHDNIESCPLVSCRPLLAEEYAATLPSLYRERIDTLRILLQACEADGVSANSKAKEADGVSANSKAKEQTACKLVDSAVTAPLSVDRSDHNVDHFYCVYDSAEVAEEGRRGFVPIGGDLARIFVFNATNTSEDTYEAAASDALRAYMIRRSHYQHSVPS